MRGEGRKGKGGPPPLAMNMGSCGWVTQQNASHILGFSGFTRHTAHSPEIQTQLFLIMPILQPHYRTPAAHC